MPGDDNSGVFIGFPPSTDPWSAVNNGYEIQIDATDATDRTTGAVYTFKSRRPHRPRRGAEPAGGVEHLRAPGRGRAAAGLPQRSEDQRLHQHRPGPLLAGHIGIQNHGTGDDVVVPQRPDQGAGHAPTPTHGAGGVVHSARAGSRRSPRRAPTAGRPSATSIPATGPRTTGSTWPVRPRSRLGWSPAVAGGTIQVRTGSATGPILGSVAVPNTGSWTTFADVSTPLSNVPSGSQNVYLTFTGNRHGPVRRRRLHLVSGATAARGRRPGQGLAGKCLDVRDGAHRRRHPDPDLHLQQQRSQTWTVTARPTIRALGKCLDVSGGGTADGTKIQLWTCNGSGAQNWTPQSDGTLRNPQSGKCLDVSGQQLGRQHLGAPLDLQHARQPEMDPELTDYPWRGRRLCRRPLRPAPPDGPAEPGRRALDGRRDGAVGQRCPIAA